MSNNSQYKESVSEDDEVNPEGTTPFNPYANLNVDARYTEIDEKFQ